MEPPALTTSSEAPRLYTKRSILAFSAIFTVIFGGVLLFSNLRKLNQRKAAWLALGFSAFYTVAAGIVVNQLPHSTPLTISINLLGGYALMEFFYRKYIGMGQEYPAKKIWKPVIISVLIVLPFLAAILYTGYIGE